MELFEDEYGLWVELSGGIQKEVYYRMSEIREVDDTKKRDREIRNLTPEDISEILEENRLLSEEERREILEKSRKQFPVLEQVDARKMGTIEGFSMKFKKDELRDPTMTRLLNNIEISTNDSDIHITMPTSKGNFEVQIHGVATEWDEQTANSNAEDILRKVLHDLKLTYRKRKKGGSYYIYSEALDSLDVQERINEEVDMTIRRNHSYYQLVEAALSYPQPSLLDSTIGSRLEDMIDEESARISFNALKFASIDRQASVLSTWEKSQSDSVSSKRENYLLRASNIEVSFLVSILIDKYLVDEQAPTASIEIKGKASSEVLEQIKDEIAGYLNEKYQLWQPNQRELRTALEYDFPQKLNALGAFDHFLQSKDETACLFGRENHIPKEFDAPINHKLLFEACKGHRVLKKEVFDACERGETSLRESISRWWMLSNQKPESYIAYQVMKGLLEGEKKILALYIPGQGAWIVNIDEDGLWRRAGNIGVGQGKGGQANPSDYLSFSPFQRKSVYGTPRAWLFQLDEQAGLDVHYFVLGPDTTRAMFLSNDLHDAQTRVSTSEEKYALSKIFSQDRKEDSESLGQWILLSPDGLIETMIELLRKEDDSESNNIWVSKNREMMESGYKCKTRGLKTKDTDFSTMLSRMNDIQYRQAYEITDAHPILHGFSENGIPSSLSAKELQRLREENLTTYDIARIAKALQKKLSLEGRYSHIDPIARNLSRLWASVPDIQYKALMDKIPDALHLDPIDKLVVKTGFLKAANFLFPLRGEIASTLDRYRHELRDLRTGSRTYQKKIWLVRALQAFERGTQPELRKRLKGFGIHSIPKYFETQISTYELPTEMNHLKRFNYVEKVRGKETLLLVESTEIRNKFSRLLLLLERNQVGSLGKESGEFINPEIEYDLEKMVLWLQTKGVSPAKEIWEQIRQLNSDAFDIESPTIDQMKQIKKELAVQYESLFALFLRTPESELVRFERSSQIDFYEILRAITSTSYVTDPRARIIGKKQFLGRPNINMQGFNLEVESSLLGRSSEHLYPFLISIFSSSSREGRRIHASRKEVDESTPRLLMGTSYAEASKWPNDIVYFYPTEEKFLTHLSIESTSSLTFRTATTKTVPMAIHDILNQKYQALDEGAIKTIHLLIADEKTETASRTHPFSYCKGKIERIVYDHRIPDSFEGYSTHELFLQSVRRNKDIQLRFLYLLENAGKLSWIDSVDDKCRQRMLGLDLDEQEALFGKRLITQQISKSRMGLPKIWVPMQRREYESVSNGIKIVVDALGGMENSDAAKIRYYFKQFCRDSKL